MAAQRAPSTPTSPRELDSQVDLLKRAAAQLNVSESQAGLKEKLEERINHLLASKHEHMPLEERLPALRRAIETKREKSVFLKFRRQELLDEVQLVETELAEVQHKTVELEKRCRPSYRGIAWLIWARHARRQGLAHKGALRLLGAAGSHIANLRQSPASKRK